MQKKELSVSAIENGTVIDHISKGVVLNVIKLLGLESCEESIYLGANLDSKKFEKKGIIKASNLFFKDEELNKIALISPNATIIEIENYEVKRKFQVQIPHEMKGMVKCANPNCITNNEDIVTHFTVYNTPDLKLKCKYCEKYTIKSSIEFIPS